MCSVAVPVCRHPSGRNSFPTSCANCVLFPPRYHVGFFVFDAAAAFVLSASQSFVLSASQSFVLSARQSVLLYVMFRISLVVKSRIVRPWDCRPFP